MDTIFTDLKAFLPDCVFAKQAKLEMLPISGIFSDVKQKELGVALTLWLGLNFDYGRLKVSHHPFCGGVTGDVRITPRYDRASFVRLMIAVIPERGHKMYQ